LFVHSLTFRLTDPRVIGLQLLVILIPAVLVRQYSVISRAHPVLTLVVIPVFAYLTLFLLVDVLQRLTLRVEEQSKANDELEACWTQIIDRTLIWLNVALLVPLLIWGVPIVGTLGYTTEAVGSLLLSEPITADHSATGVIIVGMVLLGTAMFVRSLIATVLVQLGPDFSDDRLRMYFGLRSSLRSKGEDSAAPRADGGHSFVRTDKLAAACVAFSYTHSKPDHLPRAVDIERLVDRIVPKSVSSPATFVFITTLNTRFLVGLLGGMMFIIGDTFGITLQSVNSATLVLAMAIGALSQVIFNHPFISAGRRVLKRSPGA